jgi:hypothetical protein
MKIRDPPIDITARLVNKNPISTAAVKLIAHYFAQWLPQNPIGLCQDDFKSRYPT